MIGISKHVRFVARMIIKHIQTSMVSENTLYTELSKGAHHGDILINPSCDAAVKCEEECGRLFRCPVVACPDTTGRFLQNINEFAVNFAEIFHSFVYS